MDLALEFGEPRLAKRMTERELVRWMHYAGKKGLPGRRLELYLANICRVIAQVNGNKEVTLADFLFDEAVDGADEEDELEAAKTAFNFSPRKQKEG